MTHFTTATTTDPKQMRMPEDSIIKHTMRRLEKDIQIIHIHTSILYLQVQQVLYIKCIDMKVR